VSCSPSRHLNWLSLHWYVLSLFTVSTPLRFCVDLQETRCYEYRSLFANWPLASTPLPSFPEDLYLLPSPRPLSAGKRSRSDLHSSPLLCPSAQSRLSLYRHCICVQLPTSVEELTQLRRHLQQPSSTTHPRARIGWSLKFSPAGLALHAIHPAIRFLPFPPS
jgi:hypothetical protein